MELLGILIGIRCMNWLEKGLKIEITEKHLWTDSQCVLKWLKSTKPLSVFVENRTDEIKKTNGVTFHYINTSENPADLLTRGKKFDEMNCDLWWHGPQWLSKEENKWKTWEIPSITPDVLSQIETEARGSSIIYDIGCVSQNKITSTTVSPLDIKIENHSSLNKLIRITA